MDAKGLRKGVLACALLAASVLDAASPDLWITAWTASPQPAQAGGKGRLLSIEGQTVRERVRVSAGGPRLRVRLSNEFGSSPLVVGAASVGAPVDAASVRPGSTLPLTFGGRGSVTIPAGAPVLSDPVAFPVEAGTEVSLSLYFPGRVATPTLHTLALKRCVISPRGDFSGAEAIAGGAVSTSSLLASAVLVPAGASQRVVVVFGDSFVDGDGSTVDADRSWTADLARRLVSERPGVAVVNEGLVGNRLLEDADIFGPSALARFDRDCLALPGVTHVVLLEGLNDLAFPGATLGTRLLADPADAKKPEDLIAAYRQLAARAHARGVKVIGATIPPFEGEFLPGFWSETKDAARREVNQWIRTGGAFDGVFDVDAVLRDPRHPGRMLPRFLSPDHLHPNDDGYQAMADAVDARLFR